MLIEFEVHVLVRVVKFFITNGLKFLGTNFSSLKIKTHPIATTARHHLCLRGKTIRAVRRAKPVLVRQKRKKSLTTLLERIMTT